MYTYTKNAQPNITFDSSSDSSKQKKEKKYWKYGNKEKWAKVDYRRFETAHSYQYGEPIHETCTRCERKKCSCGGCIETDVFKWVILSNRIPLCQRCLCEHTVNDTGTDIENLNDTGKSLAELVNERSRKGKPLREFTVEAYEKGEITKVTKEGQLGRRER